MEANRHAFHSSGHKCDAPTPNGVFNNCDRGGQCSLDVVHIRPDRAYGEGSQYRINTEMPFHVKTEFHKRNEEFIGYTVTLS